MRRAILAVVIFFAACCTAHPEINRYAVKGALARNVMVISTINGQLGSCAGVIFRTDLVVTAKHCVGQNMTANGYPAKVLLDDHSDLALLSAHTANFPDLETSDDVKGGDPVFSLATFEMFSDLVWVGSVIAVDKTAILSQGQNWPGMSGGGLYDAQGRLIGINSKYCCNGPSGKVPLFQIAIHARDVASLVARLPKQDITAQRAQP